MKVSKILTQKFGAQLSFSGVDFSLVPLSTTFKNVHVVKKDPTLLDVEVVAKELEVAFTYASFISSELEIDEVSVRDGSVDLDIYKKSEEDTIVRELKTREIFAKYTEVLTSLPVRLNILDLEKIKLDIDTTSLYVNKILVSPSRKGVRVKGDVSDLSIQHDSPDLAPVNITKIQLLGAMEKEEWRIDELKVEKDQNIVELKGAAFNEGSLLHLKTTGSLTANAESVLSNFKTLPSDIKAIKGDLKGEFETSGVIDNPDVTLTFHATNADTPWIKLQAVEGTVAKKKNFLIAQKLQAKNGIEEYLLRKPQAFLDLNTGKFTDFNFSLRLKNAFTNTFLLAAKDSLETLKGSVSGDWKRHFLVIEQSLRLKRKRVFRISG